MAFEGASVLNSGVDLPEDEIRTSWEMFCNVGQCFAKEGNVLCKNTEVDVL